VFPDQDSAHQFSARVEVLGYTSSAELTGCVPELPWDVVVVNHMLPTHAGITRFEAQLETIASEFGGRNDGWGCVNQKRQS
jgi:Regulator of ribonuclease activity B